RRDVAGRGAAGRWGWRTTWLTWVRTAFGRVAVATIIGLPFGLPACRARLACDARRESKRRAKARTGRGFPSQFVPRRIIIRVCNNTFLGEPAPWPGGERPAAPALFTP